MAANLGLLPPELLDLILQALVGHEYRDTTSVYTTESIRSLAAINRVCRRLRIASLPLLYRTFSHTFETYNQQAAKFLSTIFAQPSLATYIRHARFAASAHNKLHVSEQDLPLLKTALEPFRNTAIYHSWMKALAAGCFLAQCLLLVHLSSDLRKIYLVLGKSLPDSSTQNGLCKECPELGRFLQHIFSQPRSRPLLDELYLDGSRSIPHPRLQHSVFISINEPALRYMSFAKDVTLKGLRSANGGSSISALDFSACTGLHLYDSETDNATISGVLQASRPSKLFAIAFGCQGDPRIRELKIDLRNLYVSLQRHRQTLRTLIILSISRPVKVDTSLSLNPFHGLDNLESLRVDEAMLKGEKAWTDFKMARYFLPASLQSIVIMTRGGLDQYRPVVEALRDNLPSGLGVFILWSRYHDPSNRSHHRHVGSQGSMGGGGSWLLHCPQAGSLGKHLLLGCHKTRSQTDFPQKLKEFAGKMATPYGPSISPIFYFNFKLAGRVNCRSPQQLERVVSRAAPCTLARLEGMVPA